jgi:alpha-1,2-mannosyltransferase
MIIECRVLRRRWSELDQLLVNDLVNSPQGLVAGSMMNASRTLRFGDRRRRLVVGTAWLAGGCSAGLAVAGALAFALGRQIDISVYLNGASHLLDGRLYQVRLPQPPHLVFTYPPFAAVLFWPLTVIPVKAAHLIWGLVNVVALYAVVRLSLRAALRAAAAWMAVLASLILLAPVYWLDPVHRTLMYGQVNLVLAALVLADFTGPVTFRGRWLPRGVLVGIASAIKLTPLVFVLYLLVTRRRRAAGMALAAFATCCAAAAALSPGASWLYWSRYVFNTSRMGPVYYISDQSLRAVADRAAHAIASPALVTLVSAAVLAGGLALAAWAFRASSDLLGVLISAATGLLVSPVTWDHHMVWIVPAIIWLAGAADRPAGGWAWALAAAVLFWWAPIWAVPHGHGAELHESFWQFLGGSSFFLAVVAFLFGNCCHASHLAPASQASRSQATNPRPTRECFGNREGGMMASPRDELLTVGQVLAILTRAARRCSLALRLTGSASQRRNAAACPDAAAGSPSTSCGLVKASPSHRLNRCRLGIRSWLTVVHRKTPASSNVPSCHLAAARSHGWVIFPGEQP